jgi:hypothetical protein
MTDIKTHALAQPLALFRCNCGEAFVTLSALYDHIDAETEDEGGAA